jgi:hypothetical protein
MSRGIYITADNAALDNAIALLNSIRIHDRDTPVMMIPYNDRYGKAARTLNDLFGVELYDDKPFLNRFTENIRKIFGDNFFKRPEQFRKQLCWFGPFDEFLYLDTDIIVFEKIVDFLDYLKTNDFVCCDYQFKNKGKYIFRPEAEEAGILNEEQLKNTFNAGLWASKKRIVSEKDLYDVFTECARHRDYFDFSAGVSDMPIFNYFVITRFKKVFNIARFLPGEPGQWAGAKHFIARGNMLYDPNAGRNLRYLHWAGIRIEPGCPRWDLWKHYRDLKL